MFELSYWEIHTFTNTLIYSQPIHYFSTHSLTHSLLVSSNEDDDFIRELEKLQRETHHITPENDPTEVLDRLAAEEEELQNKIKQENSEILAKQAENIKKNAGKISKSGNLHSHLLTHSLTYLLTYLLTCL